MLYLGLLLRVEVRGYSCTPEEIKRRKSRQGGGKKENNLLTNREKKEGEVCPRL